MIWLHHPYPCAEPYRRFIIQPRIHILQGAIGFSVSWLRARYFVLLFNRIRRTRNAFPLTRSRILALREISLCYPRAIREGTDGGGWKYARDVSLRYNGRWCLLSTTGRLLLLCVTAEERDTPLHLPPHFILSSVSSPFRPTSERICELNSNGNPPFRSFQRVLMFSLRLIYSRKAPFLLCLCPLGVCFSSFLLRLDAVTQAGRSHSDFVPRQLHVEDSTTLKHSRFTASPPR